MARTDGERVDILTRSQCTRSPIPSSAPDDLVASPGGVGGAHAELEERVVGQHAAALHEHPPVAVPIHHLTMAV